MGSLSCKCTIAFGIRIALKIIVGEGRIGMVLGTIRESEELEVRVPNK